MEQGRQFRVLGKRVHVAAGEPQLLEAQLGRAEETAAQPLRRVQTVNRSQENPYHTARCLRRTRVIRVGVRVRQVQM